MNIRENLRGLENASANKLQRYPFFSNSYIHGDKFICFFFETDSKL